MKKPKAETRIQCHEIADYRINPFAPLSRDLNSDKPLFSDVKVRLNPSNDIGPRLKLFLKIALLVCSISRNASWGEFGDVIIQNSFSGLTIITLFV
jgi:hypothetical protein